MLAFQKSVGANGKQNYLFPLTHMYVSQDEYGSYSHSGTLNMDFLGWNNNGRVYKCPYYAPCDCKCVAKGSGGDWVGFESLAEVNLANGTTGYVSWLQVHDDTPCNVGDTFHQGDVIGHTGTTGNVTGDHLHYNVAKGKYASWQGTSPNQLNNSIHIYDACFIDGTTIVQQITQHTWISTGDDPVVPTPITKNKKKKYKFILFKNASRYM